jgi:5-methylcytosine-specific restriction enzyme A
MPTKPLSPCRHPGCPALISSGGYCEAHRKSSPAAQYDERRKDTFATRYHGSAQWKRIRTLHKAQHPLCCDPFGDHGGYPAPNEQSHHIWPLATHPELASTMENLAPLCTTCHGKVERLERAGTATQHLFAGAALTAKQVI